MLVKYIDGEENSNAGDALFTSTTDFTQCQSLTLALIKQPTPQQPIAAIPVVSGGGKRRRRRRYNRGCILTMHASENKSALPRAKVIFSQQKNTLVWEKSKTKRHKLPLQRSQNEKSGN